MTSPSPNINVVSNIYPTKTVTTVQLPGLPESVTGAVDDLAFRRKIRCRKALVALSELTHGAVIDDRRRIRILLDNNLVSEDQIKAYWGYGRAVDCPPGERPWGLGPNGVECRCEILNCPGRNDCFPPTSSK